MILTDFYLIEMIKKRDEIEKNLKEAEDSDALLDTLFFRNELKRLDQDLEHYKNNG